jgi:hypothetical protein
LFLLLGVAAQAQSGLVLLNFDEGTGTTVADISGIILDRYE